MDIHHMFFPLPNSGIYSNGDEWRRGESKKFTEVVNLPDLENWLL